MPIDQRKRNDATITQVQGGILAGVLVRYFESLADKTKGGVGARLRGDTLALCAPEPYTGSFPPKDVAEAAARQAAISSYMSVVKRGGPELVMKAAAGDGEAAAESKAKASAGLEPEKQAARGKREGKRGGARVRVSEDGKERKTKHIKALPADTTEEDARAHFSTLGLSTENPLARCETCQWWNLCHPVFADDLSRASGVRNHQKGIPGTRTTKRCGTFKAV